MTIGVRRMLPNHELRKVAVAAEADPRTVRKFIKGEPVQGLVGERIRRALNEAGWIPVAAAKAVR